MLDVEDGFVTEGTSNNAYIVMGKQNHHPRPEQQILTHQPAPQSCGLQKSGRWWWRTHLPSNESAWQADAGVHHISHAFVMPVSNFSREKPGGGGGGGPPWL